MSRAGAFLPLAQLRPGEAFPPLEAAWPADSPSPGLLAVGGALDAATLRRAYAAAIFPWFAPGEPLLWWSPQPRMSRSAVWLCSISPHAVPTKSVRSA